MLVQIETQQGLDNLEAIAAVDGVDGVFIGPGDLSAALGYLGDPGQSGGAAGRSRTRSAGSRRAARRPGILTGDETLARRCIELGCLFTAVGADVGILARGSEQLARQVQELRLQSAIGVRRSMRTASPPHRPRTQSCYDVPCWQVLAIGILSLAAMSASARRLPDADHHHHRAWIARRGHRHRGAPRGPPAQQDLGPAGRRREQDRCRQHDRHRLRRQVRARRLHGADHRRRARHQPVALQEDGVRLGQGLRAGRARRHRAAAAGRAGIAAGQQRPGADRLHQGPSGRGLLRLQRHRPDPAHVGGAVQEHRPASRSCTCPTRAAPSPIRT